VYNIEGGMNAWQGIVAEGPPESGMAYFEGTEKPEELIGLAWILEDGSRKFYTSLSDLSEDKDAKELFLKLTDAEEHHKKSLIELYRNISVKEPGETFPQDFVSTEALGDFMEGGMSVSEGIDWVKRNGLQAALELSVSLEANSYDLYIKMSRSIEYAQAQTVFKTLVTEEKYHLEQLAQLLEKKL
jgi:rubrerythrin